MKSSRKSGYIHRNFVTIFRFLANRMLANIRE
jgi:hypothetical protein